ncbi:MAG: GNAT family N-acetyltransferase [Blastocatellia bacterium]|nr:GNAT family N-acetyltransferase [Blastocatellia bacterium]
MTIEIRYAGFDEYPQISRFLAAHWSPDNIYVRERRLFDWTFGRSALWDRDGYSFALAEEGDEVVGILGAIPFAFNRFGASSQALWLANYMIAPAHRRGPLAVRLLQSMRRDPYTATIAFGINPRTAPIYQVLRWRIVQNIPRHIVVLPQAVDRMAELIRLAHEDLPAANADAIARRFARPESRVASTACDHELPLDWDERGWRPMAKTTIGAARDRAYLTWRYLEHPLFEYRLLALREADRIGLLIWRLETIRRATSAGEIALDRIGRVVEWIPCSRENARELAGRLLTALREADAIGADFYCHHGEIRQWIAEAGVLPVEENEEGARIPARFQPLDAKSPAICSSIYSSEPLPDCASDADSAWYWTKSDADQDRPN